MASTISPRISCTSCLRRVDGAPLGTSGLSLFIVPKFLPDADGALGRRNDLRCVSLEHKLGIHASPTCVMSYGDDDGAEGFLLGEENQGMRCMFTMMNNARLAVGHQGLGLAERALQQASAYAHERVQGRAARQAVPIVQHADVRRMLLTMRAQIAAMRALAYWTASFVDRSERHPDAGRARLAAERVALLTPMVKAWCTDLAQEITADAILVQGGMGFIEETGAAQYFRDARILAIYEGTNGIQALDLVGRKLDMAGGAVPWRLLAELREELPRLAGGAGAATRPCARRGGAHDPAAAVPLGRRSCGRSARPISASWPRPSVAFFSPAGRPQPARRWVATGRDLRASTCRALLPPALACEAQIVAGVALARDVACGLSHQSG